MSEAHVPRHTYAEYLEIERTTEERHEFIDGVVLAMSGGSPTHARLGSRVAMIFGRQLEGSRCVPYSSDLRVRVPETGRATYADLAIVCGHPETHPEDADAVTNPVVLVEVLSPATERDDRGEKFAQYRKLASLRDYVLVSQEVPRVEHFLREGDRWIFREAGPGEQITLSIGAVLGVDELFAGIGFPGPGADPPHAR